MVKKKGEKRPKATGRGSGRSMANMTRFKTAPIQPTSFFTEDRPARTSQPWTGLRNDLGNQINDIIGAQRKRLMMIRQRMAEISSEVGPTGGSLVPSKDLIAQLSMTWEKYQPEMKGLLKRLLDAGNGNFETLDKRWTDLSSRMQKALSSLSNAKDLPKAQLELLEIWLGLSREMSTRISEGMGSGSAELVRLRDTWSSLMTDMNTLALELQGQNPWMSKAVERMRISSQEMNNDLMSYMEDSYGHMIRLQSLWMTRMSQMSQGLMNAVVSGEPFFLGEMKGSRCRSSAHRSV